MSRFSASLARRLWGIDQLPATLEIEPRRPGTAIPLSFSQLPMWFAEQLDPGTPAYNAFEAMRLRGSVDENALRFALDEIVRRHEILRTAFYAVDGRPAQTVLDYGSFPLETVDRTDLAADLPGLRRFCEDVVRTPFDFARGRLARALLVRLGPEDSALVLVMHHIVRDLSGMGVVLAEMSELCRAYAAGSPADLPPLTVQYGDFCVWQHRLAESGAFEKQRAFWSRELAGAPASYEVPGDRPPPATDDADGGMCEALVDRATADALRTLGSHADASFFMVLVAAFQTLLYRCAGEPDVITGFPVAGRARPELAPLVGCFINTVVLRTVFEKNVTFRTLLTTVRRNALAAYDNQDYPFEKLVEDLRPERRPGQNPVVQTLATLMDRRRPALRLPGVVVEPLALRRGASKLDVSLEMDERPEGLVCRLEYRRAIYDDASAARLLRHFAHLLGSIARDPDEAVERLELMTVDERDTITKTWNPHVDVPVERCAHELIEDWVARAPQAPALESAGSTLSYAELGRRADLLAARLRQAGAGPGSIVGIFLDRSFELIVAMLGVMKCGAAYLPLDTAYPPARVAFMVTNSSASLVVTSSPLAGSAAIAGAPVIAIDAPETPERAAAANGAPPAKPGPGDLAYVIYTSGTTGTPKGVAIEHRALVSYLHAAIAQYAISPHDRTLQFGSPSFDASVKEIFATLASGATLVLRDDAMIASPQTFLRTCEELGITVLDPPTAYWHELAAAVDAREATIPRSLRVIAVGGEAIGAEHVVRWQRAAGDSRALYNGYGPTETTVSATGFNVPPAAEAARFSSIPIGRPLANSRCYVLDDLQQPTPINVAGELYVGGSSVARGYLGDPVTTAARFLPDPFVAWNGRMYRTGDRARFLADGTIEFLGRIDRQIKLRGFRIEPGEIENVLLRHTGVREAVVDVDRAGADPQLTAFVTAREPHAVTPDDLLAYLRSELPAHMVPARTIVLDTLPMTGSGKVDRTALHAVARAVPASRPSFAAPRTPVECAVAAIWREVLAVESVGLTDDFFALGGHSLRAAAAAARLNAAFDVVIPLRALFEHRTLGELSAAVVRAQAQASDPDALAALLDELEGTDDAARARVTP